jgi:methanogenic corrinoid protein MtbC1
VKRWVDDGVLPAHRTAGGHRKMLLSDVFRLVRDGNLPKADLTQLLSRAPVAPSENDVLFRQLMEAIHSADSDLIRNLLIGGYQSGIPIETLADRVIAPALMQLGHDWAMGRMNVMTEHRITQACITAMYELRAVLSMQAEANRPVAVGGAPEHDHYVLPTLLAKLTLLDAGWNAINLGPHTPITAFATAIQEIRPALIWICVTHLPDPESFLKQYAELYQLADRHGVAIALGGRGLTENIRGRMIYTMYGDGFTQLAAFAKSLHRRPSPPKRGRRPNSAKKPNSTETSSSHPALDFDEDSAQPESANASSPMGSN